MKLLLLSSSWDKLTDVSNEIKFDYIHSQYATISTFYSNLHGTHNLNASLVFVAYPLLRNFELIFTTHL